MALILAIEPDRRQATQLRAVVRELLQADLVLADSAEHALAELGSRVPDLILTSQLLSPRDEAALNERLRALERAAQFVQTLTIPMLAAPTKGKRAGGMLAALRRQKPKKGAIDGLDPAVFAEQCAEYLERATGERARHASEIAEAVERAALAPPPPSTAEPVHEPAFRSGDYYVATADVTPAVDDPIVAPQPDYDAPPLPRETFAQAPQEDASDPDGPEPYVTPASAFAASRKTEPQPIALPEPDFSPAPPMPADDHLYEPLVVSGPDPVAVHDEAVVEGTHAVEEQAAAPVVDEAVETSESQSSREDDLQLFDLDLDALSRLSEHTPTVVVEATPAREEVPQAITTAALDAGGMEEEEEEEEEAGDETDLQVYDLDLSSLIGEPAHQGEPTNQRPEATVQAPPAAIEPPRLVEVTAPQRVDSPSHNRDTAPVKSRAAVPSRDEDVEVYDLDLNLVVESPDDQHSTSAAATAPTPLVDAKTRPAVEAAPHPIGPRAVEPPIVASTPSAARTPKSDVRVSAPRAKGDTPAAVAASGEELADAVQEPEPTRQEIEDDARTVIDSGLWAPLRLGAHKLWPRLEGGVAQGPKLAVSGPADAPVARVLPPTPAPVRSSVEPKRPEWLNVIKSLKRDGANARQPEQSAPPVQQAQTATRETPAQSPQIQGPRETPRQSEQPDPQSRPAALSGAPPTPVPPAPETPASGPSKSKRRRLARKAKKGKLAQEDWGFFDPEKYGFTALVTKLDEIADKQDAGAGPRSSG